MRQTSGTQILDAAALSAVKAAQPFPPVPDAVAKRTLVIDWTFRYQNDSGAQNVPFWEMPLPATQCRRCRNEERRNDHTCPIAI